MKTIFDANPFAGSPFLGQAAGGPSPRLGLPMALAPRTALGQQRALDTDDARALKKMSVDDLVTLGQVVSCGKILATNDAIKILVDVVGTVYQAFEFLGLQKPDDLTQAAKDAVQAEDSRRKISGTDVNAMLAAITNEIFSRQPDWEVAYYEWSGDVIIKGPKGEVRKRVSLGAPDPTFGGALRFVDDHSDILDRMKEASRLSGLGNPGWILLVLGIILIVAAAVVAIIWILSDQRQRWLDRLGREMADKQAQNERDKTRMAEIEAKGAAASDTEQAEKKRLQEDIRHREAGIREAEKAAKALREAGGVVSEIIRALGIAPIIQGILIGSGIILLTGLAVWVFGKGPKPATTAMIRA